MTNLPLLHDEEEAKVMHELFITMVEQRNVRIFGVYNENLAMIVGILVNILVAGYSSNEVQTLRRAYSALNGLHILNADELIREMVACLTVKQRKKYDKVLQNVA